MLTIIRTMSSLLGGICNAKLRIWVLFHELCAKGARNIWNDVTDNEAQVLLLHVLLGEEVVGHLVPHSAKTDEACGARSNKLSISGLQASKS